MRLGREWLAYVDDLTVRSGRVVDGMAYRDCEYDQELKEACRRVPQVPPQAPHEALEALGFNPAGLGDEADARKSKRKYDPVSADRNHPFAHVFTILRDGVTFLRTRASLFALFVCVQVVCVQSRQFHVHAHDFDFDVSVAPAAVWFEQTLLGGCSSSLGANTTTFHIHNLLQFMSTGSPGSGGSGPSGGSGDTGSSPAVNPQVTGGSGPAGSDPAAMLAQRRADLAAQAAELTRLEGISRSMVNALRHRRLGAVTDSSGWMCCTTPCSTGAATKTPRLGP